MKFADMQVAGQAAGQRQQAVALFDGFSDVAQQDAQAILRVTEQKCRAGILDQAVVVQPGLQIWSVNTQAAVRLS